jgi:hypothetical protein
MLSGRQVLAGPGKLPDSASLKEGAPHEVAKTLALKSENA